jgi:hypothetical protein
MTAPLIAPATAAAGIWLAFGPGSGGNSRPARPSISGTVVALVVLVGSLVFGASLSNLVSHPALYGWTWDREMLAGSGYGNIPLSQARLMLGYDPDIAAWSGAYFDSVEINGHSVPVIAMTSTRISPPILAGHALAGPAQIVLGPETLALVGGRVGGTVRVFNGKTTLIMRVTGTATMPAIGVGHGIHSSLGGGAVLPASALPQDVPAKGVSNRALRGPNTILIRFRPGADHAAATQRLERIGGRLSGIRSVEGIQVLPVQRPAEIVNYRTMGAAPLVLAGMLTVGAVVALVLTLAASVRRQTRDLALLKNAGIGPQAGSRRGDLAGIDTRRDRNAGRRPSRNRGRPVPVGQIRQRALCRASAGHLDGDGSCRRHIHAGPGHPDRHRARLAGSPHVRCQRAPGGVSLTVPDLR